MPRFRKRNGRHLISAHSCNENKENDEKKGQVDQRCQIRIDPSRSTGVQKAHGVRSATPERVAAIAVARNVTSRASAMSASIQFRTVA